MVAVLKGAELGPNFDRLIAALYSDIESIVRVNGFFQNPSSLLYVLALKSLLEALEMSGDMSHDLWCETGATAYLDDISIIVSDEGQLS